MIFKCNCTILDELNNNNWIVKLRKSPVVCKILEFSHPDDSPSDGIIVFYTSQLCKCTDFCCLLHNRMTSFNLSSLGYLLQKLSGASSLPSTHEVLRLAVDPNRVHYSDAAITRLRPPAAFPSLPHFPWTGASSTAGCNSHSGNTNLHEHIKNVIVGFPGQRAQLLLKQQFGGSVRQKQAPDGSVWAPSGQNNSKLSLSPFLCSDWLFHKKRQWVCYNPAKYSF